MEWEMKKKKTQTTISRIHKVKSIKQKLIKQKLGKKFQVSKPQP